MSTPPSFWFDCFYAPKWSPGKVYWYASIENAGLAYFRGGNPPPLTKCSLMNQRFYMAIMLALEMQSYTFELLYLECKILHFQTKIRNKTPSFPSFLAFLKEKLVIDKASAIANRTLKTF